jgi:uncharacterized protein (TIGR02588 family)
MTLPPPPPINNKRIGNGVIVVLVIITIIVIAAVAFVALPLLGVTAPKPEITMTQGREGVSGFNYVYYVDATVVNQGASGSVTVYAEISGAGRNEQQQTSVYLASGQSQTVTLTFDVNVLGSLSNPTITYRAWAHPN